MGKIDSKYRASPEYRFWLYDPEGDGMTFYRSEEDRNRAAEMAIDAYLDSSDGWCEEVEIVCVGEVTHAARCLNKQMRPDDLDEDGIDGSGECWGDFQWKGHYKLEPLAAEGGEK